MKNSPLAITWGGALALIQRHWMVALPYLVLGIVVRAWFLPGLIAGSDFATPPFSSFASLDHTAFWPPSFDMTLNTGFSMQAWWGADPIWTIVGVLHRNGISWDILSRIFWLWPLFLLLVAAPYRFLLRRGIAPGPAAVGAMVFALNTWTVGLIARGHIPALIAYTLMPVIVDALLRLLDKPERRSILWLMATATLQVMFEVRYTYLTAAICAFVCVVLWIRAPHRYARKPVVGAVLWAGAGILVANAYWLLAIILTPVALARGSTGVGALVQISGSLTLLNAIALYYPFYHFSIAYPPFQYHPVEAPFLLVTLVAAIGFYLGRRRPLCWLLAVVGIAGIVMTSGPSSTFGGIVTFVYQHVPGMIGFRDLTKMMSLIAFATAVGVALATNRITSLLRLHFSRRMASIVAIVAIAGITLLMRDAFDPFRLMNYSITMIRPADRALQRFIDTAPGNGDIMLFPSYFPTIGGSLKHRILLGVAMGQSAIPVGFNSIVDSADPQTAFSMFQSPVARRVLAEIGMQYVVVVDDPTNVLYLPPYDNIQRGESLRFFDSQTWLQRYAKIGNNVIYRVRDAAPGRRAFYATCPVAFDADERTLDALTGTPLLNGDPGIVMVGDQTLSTNMSALPNVLVGAYSMSPTDDPTTMQRGLAYVRQAIASARFVSRPYKAFAITQQAMTSMKQKGESYLKASWVAAEPGSWRIVSGAGPTRLQSAVTQTMSFPTSVSSSPPPLVGIPIYSSDSVGVGFGSGATASANGSWTFSSAEINISNPFDGAVRADVVLPSLRSAISWPVQAALQGADQVVTGTMPPQDGLLAWLPGGSLTLRAVLLEPGLNRFTVSSPDQSPLIALGNPELQNPTFLPASSVLQRLAIQARASASGFAIGAQPLANPNAPANGRVRLLSSLDIPLSHLPSISFRYSLKSDVLGAYVAYGLEDLNGKTVELRQSLNAEETSSQLNVSLEATTAFNSIRDNEDALHSGDISWLVARAPYPPDVSGMVLRYVDVVLVKPPDIGARQASTLDISDLAVTTSASDTYEGPFERVAQKIDLSTVRMEGGSQGRFFASAVGHSPGLFSMRLNYVSPQQALAPTGFAAGDFLTIQLNNGRVLDGQVASADARTILLTTATSQVGVSRSAIATIERVVPASTGDIVVHIPVKLRDPEATVRLLLQVPAWLAYTMRLGISDDESGTIRYVAATNQRDLVNVDPPIPPAWLGSQTIRSEAPVQQMGAIFGPSTPPVPSPSWTKISLDLQSIYLMQTPELIRPRLRSIDIRFHPTTTMAGPLDGTVFLANVETILGDENHTARPSFAQSSSLRVDGKALSWLPLTMSDNLATAESTTPVLAAGTHYVETVGEINSEVRSATVERGAPVCVDKAPPFTGLNESEIVGTTADSPGLLVANNSYDSNWRLALLPAGVEPTGNILLDLLETRGRFVPNDLHYVVNGNLNGWWVGGRPARALIIFLPTAIDYISASLELPLLFIFLVLMWKYRR